MNQDSKYDPRGPVPTHKIFRKRKPIPELLARYRVTESGCWEWTATRNRKGYGVVGIALNGRPVGIPAPRLQWMHHHGEIPPGHVIMHFCDNPPCINPDHLRCGTQAENLADMRAKGRQSHKGVEAVVKFMDRYRRNEVPFMGKFRSERHKRTA